MISLCMIAKNEEKNIANAINSVREAVDEIIVVDTGSIDDTKEAAKRLGAKVYDFKWNDDFSEARNFALSKCTGDWILVLDADELISKEDAKKIRELVKGDAVAYSFIQRTYSNIPSKIKWNQNDNVYPESKGYAGWSYRGIIRLFRNLPEIRFIYPIHESVKPSAQKIGRIENSRIPIHHFTRHSRNKGGYYLKLLEDKARKYPIANSYAELAVHLYNMSKEADALFYAEKAAKLNSSLAYLCEAFAKKL